MEWFALAIDSLILILGFIYFVLKFIFNHTKKNAPRVLLSIANFGNDIYKTIILCFSDRRKILFGFSILLTLHMIVDVGVFYFLTQLVLKILCMPKDLTILKIDTLHF